MGSRYGGLKQLDSVGENGETVLEYAVYDAVRAGFSRVVFVIRREFEAAFREYVDSRFGSRVDIAYAFQSVDELPNRPNIEVERSKPWGTAHAVWSARQELSGPFAVVNADDFYGQDAFAQVATFLRLPEEQRANKAALIGFILANTLSPHGGVSRGVCSEDQHGYLQRIEELTNICVRAEGPTNIAPDGSTRRLTGDERVSMNMWGFSSAILEPLERELARFLGRLEAATAAKAECYLPACVDTLVGNKQLRVQILPTSGRWFGVTYPNDKPTVQAALHELRRTGEYPRELWSR